MISKPLMQKFALIAFLVFASSIVKAVPITMSAVSNNLLTITFTAPVQNPAHNTLGFGLWSSSRSGTLEGTSSLFENGILLGSGDTATSSLGGWFTNLGSSRASNVFTVSEIDFGAIADGVTNGLITFAITNSTPGAFYQFDSNDIYVNTFGDSGGFNNNQPNVTGFSVSTVTAAVPEGATTFGLVSITLVGLVALRRRYSGTRGRA